MPEPLVLFARLTPRPEHYAECRDALLAMAEPTRREPGCLAFEPHEALPPDGTLYLHEVFTDREAFEAHLAADHTRALFGRLDTWLAEPVDGMELRRLAP